MRRRKRPRTREQMRNTENINEEDNDDGQIKDKLNSIENLLERKRMRSEKEDRDRKLAQVMYFNYTRSSKMLNRFMIDAQGFDKRASTKSEKR
jgi:hypothetical protein